MWTGFLKPQFLQTSINLPINGLLLILSLLEMTEDIVEIILLLRVKKLSGIRLTSSEWHFGQIIIFYF
jgi:hypothetical protein